MSLSKKQQQFTGCVASLITYAYSKGYGLTFGDAFRDGRVHGDFGEKIGYAAGKSVHKLRLAVDLNLFIDGEYITGDCPEYQDLGQHWKSLDDDARWGGDFNDFNHFSFMQWGCK